MYPVFLKFITLETAELRYSGTQLNEGGYSSTQTKTQKEPEKQTVKHKFHGAKNYQEFKLLS